MHVCGGKIYICYIYNRYIYKVNIWIHLSDEGDEDLVVELRTAKSVQVSHSLMVGEVKQMRPRKHCALKSSTSDKWMDGWVGGLGFRV